MSLPAEPQEFPAAFAAAWMARDAAALASLFAQDAEFVNVVGLWWHSRAEIERAHAYGLTTFFAESTLRPGVVRRRPLAPGLALVQCRFRLTGQKAPDGSVAAPRQTVMSFVLEDTGAGWQALAAQNTDVVPGAETHVNDGSGFRAADYRKR